MAEKGPEKQQIVEKIYEKTKDVAKDQYKIRLEETDKIKKQAETLHDFLNPSESIKKMSREEEGRRIASAYAAIKNVANEEKYKKYFKNADGNFDEDIAIITIKDWVDALRKNEDIKETIPTSTETEVEPNFETAEAEGKPTETPTPAPAPALTKMQQEQLENTVASMEEQGGIPQITENIPFDSESNIANLLPPKLESKQYAANESIAGAPSQKKTISTEEFLTSLIKPKITYEMGDEEKKTITRNQEIIKAREETLKKYLKEYEKRAEKKYDIKVPYKHRRKKLLIKNWKDLSESRKFIETTLMREMPFGLDRDSAKAKTAEIMAKGLNDRVYLQDIFDAMEGFPAIRKKYPDLVKYLNEQAEYTPTGEDEGEVDVLSNHYAFIEVFEDLKEKYEANVLNDKEKKYFQIMFYEIMAPCFDLLESISDLRYNPTEAKSRKIEVDLKPENMNEVEKGIYNICSYQTRGIKGIWEGLINLKGDMTMVGADGKQYYVDKGILQKHMTPASGYHRLTNLREGYTLDAQGGKEYDEQAITKYVNETMLIGFLQMKMQELMRTDKGKSLTPEEVEIKVKEFKAEIEANPGKYKIQSIKELSHINELDKDNFDDYEALQIYAERIKAFQIGFIAERAINHSKNVKEGREALTEQSEIIKNTASPVIAKILKGFKEDDPNLTEHELEAIRSFLAAGITMEYDTTTDSITSVGAGTGINIPGTNLSIAIGIKKTEGNVDFGTGMNIQLWRNPDKKAPFQSAGASAGVSLSGIGVGADQKLRWGPVDFKLMEGAQLSFKDGIMLGGGFILNRNLDDKLAKRFEREKNNSGLQELFEKWKGLKDHQVEEKYETLKKLKPLYTKIEPFEKTFKLEKEYVVMIAQGIMDQVEAKTYAELKDGLDWLPIFSGVGFAMWGPVPVPLVEFKFGSAKLVVPHKNELDKYSDIYSQARAQKAINDAIEETKDPNKQGTLYKKFTEITGEIILGKDGKYKVVKEVQDLDINRLQTSIEAINEKLKDTAEIVLEEKGDITKIKILNKEYKDVSLMIDPMEHDMMLVKDGADIYLAGNRNDFTVSRIRTFLPAEDIKDGVTIRDQIFISTSDSRKGKRTLNWIADHSGLELRSLHNEPNIYIHKAADYKYEQKNIIEISGFGTSGLNAIQNEDTKQLIKKAIEGSGGSAELTKEKLENKIVLTNERLNTMGVILKGEFLEQNVRPNLKQELDRMFKNPEFKSSIKGGFTTVMGDPEKMAQQIIKFADAYGLEGIGDEGHERELNIALSYMTHKWFTVFSKDYQKNKKKINTLIRKRVERNRDFARNHVLIPEFKEVIPNIYPPISMDAEDVADQLIADTYDKFIEETKKEDFDLTKINVEEIPVGAMLFSSTRLTGNKERRGALAKFPTITEVTKLGKDVPKAKEFIHEMGFLKGTITEYKLENLKESDPKLKKNGEIARVLLEIASPTPKLKDSTYEDDIKFMKSPLALKMASLSVGAFMIRNDEYMRITDLYNDLEYNLQAIHGSPDYKDNQEYLDALQTFKKLIHDIREAQLKGESFTMKSPDSDITIEIGINTKIKGGAYSQCSNQSFYVSEVGIITLYRGDDTIDTYTETDMILNPKDAKMFVKGLAGVGIVESKEAKSKSETEEPDKDHEEGPDYNPDDDKGAAKGMEYNTSDGKIQ